MTGNSLGRRLRTRGSTRPGRSRFTFQRGTGTPGLAWSACPHMNDTNPGLQVLWRGVGIVVKQAVNQEMLGSLPGR